MTRATAPRLDRPLGAAPPPTRAVTLLDAARTVLLRTIAVALFVATAALWAHVLGANVPGAALVETPAFLALPRPWQATVSVLAALVPVAALGLWFARSWGAVLWLLTVAVHVGAIAQGWWPDVGTAPLVGFHAVTVALFVAIGLARAVLERRSR